MSDEEIESYKDRFFEHLSQTVPGRKELVVTEARGATIKTADGRLFLDFISGIAVANVGHSHPEVVAAAQEQMARYAHVNVYGRFVLPPKSRSLSASPELRPTARRGVPHVDRHRGHRRLTEAGPQVHGPEAIRGVRAWLPRSYLRFVVGELETRVPQALRAAARRRRLRALRRFGGCGSCYRR